MTIKTDIDQLVTNAAKVHAWAHGNSTHTEMFGGMPIQSPAKLIADNTVSANAAAASATTASTQATNASNSATAAATSATAAATSATNAATSAANAASAQTAAEAARDATLNAYDNFDDRYLGAKASDPALDNDGNALVAGALYFNSTDGVMKLYTGSAWVAAYVSGAGFLVAANNLSDVANVAAARANLGVGYTSKTVSSNTTLATDTEYETGRNLRVIHGVTLAIPASTKLIVRNYGSGLSF
jgi:hypothetical protein